MKKYTSITIILLILLAGAGVLWTYFFSPEAQEKYIKNEIVKANYCEVKADCQMVAMSQCPFGCYVHVNKNEADRIGKLIEGYESNCMYSCIEFKGVECVNNSCELVK